MARILVIDDEEDVRRVVDVMLTNAGHNVVLAVDGRKPSSPARLLRILRSYEQGESFKIDLLRNKKHETVTAKRKDPKQ